MLLRSIRLGLRARSARGGALALVAALAVTGTSLPCAGVCLEHGHAAHGARAGAALYDEHAEHAEHAEPAGDAARVDPDGADSCPDGHCPPASPCLEDQTPGVLDATGDAAPAATAGARLAALTAPASLVPPAPARMPAGHVHLAPDRSPPLAVRPAGLRI